jgi:hypothetical protein
MSEELTTADVAAKLNRPERTVRLWCKQGRFEGARPVSTPRGDYWTIPAAALKTFQEPERGRPAKPKPEPAAKKARGRPKKQGAKSAS